MPSTHPEDPKTEENTTARNKANWIWIVLCCNREQASFHYRGGKATLFSFSAYLHMLPDEKQGDGGKSRYLRFI